MNAYIWYVRINLGYKLSDLGVYPAYVPTLITNMAAVIHGEKCKNVLSTILIII